MRLISSRGASILILVSGVLLLSSCQKGESTPLKASREMISRVDTEIEAYEEALKDSPDVIVSYITLGQLYLQKIRETADISYSILT